MAAAKLIAFEPRGGVKATEPAARIRNPRYRGLQLAVSGAREASLPEDTQAQACRIVAQVEWEIEQQAAREQAAAFQTLRQNACSRKDLKITVETESPATVARRVLSAFRDFAHLVRPAKSA